MWVKTLEAGEQKRLDASGDLRVYSWEKTVRPRPFCPAFQGFPRMSLLTASRD